MTDWARVDCIETEIEAMKASLHVGIVLSDEFVGRMAALQAERAQIAMNAALDMLGFRPGPKD